MSRPRGSQYTHHLGSHSHDAGIPRGSVPRSSTAMSTQSNFTESPSNMSMFILEDPSSSSSHHGVLDGGEDSHTSEHDDAAAAQPIKYIPSRASSQILPRPARSCEACAVKTPTHIVLPQIAGGDTPTTPGSRMSLNSASPLTTRGRELASMSPAERAMTIRPVVSIEDCNKGQTLSHQTRKVESADEDENENEDKENDPPVRDDTMIISGGVNGSAF